MKKQAEMLKAMNQEERRAGTCPVSRLYGQVTVFRWTRTSSCSNFTGRNPESFSGWAISNDFAILLRVQSADRKRSARPSRHTCQ